jgi:hypothetical protein
MKSLRFRLALTLRRTAPLGVAGCLIAAHAASAAGLGDVFVIDMENHNFTQPSTYTGTQAVFGNVAAPYINSLITAGNANAAQVSWASNYYNAASGVHPSLPSYLWQEEGTNNGVFNDNMPFGTGGVNQGANQSLSGLLQSNGISWKSYQEDIDLATDGLGKLTSTVLPQNQWTVPLNNVSGTGSTYVNPYNGSSQYNFATKHDGELYFNATNGGNDTTTSNPEVAHYAPLQQLTNDLNNNTVARYNVISPDQFNDAHTALTGGFTYNGTHYTGDAANIAQGDNFLSILVPQIMASQAYQNNGAISIWWDETEGGDSTSFTLMNAIISPLAKGNAFNSTTAYTHSSDLKTWQEAFGVTGGGAGYLGDAANPTTSDLSGLFQSNVIPQVASSAPEPAAVCLLVMGLVGPGAAALRRRRNATGK